MTNHNYAIKWWVQGLGTGGQGVLVNCYVLKRCIFARMHVNCFSFLILLCLGPPKKGWGLGGPEPRPPSLLDPHLGIYFVNTPTFHNFACICISKTILHSKTQRCSGLAISNNFSITISINLNQYSTLLYISKQPTKQLNLY